MSALPNRRETSTVTVEFDTDTLRLLHGYWYLATPYSKYPDGLEAAFKHACQIAGQLISSKIPVYSPISHTHPIALYSGMDQLNHQIWLPADEPLMDAAHGLLVAELPSWRESYGIRIEIERFTRNHKPVINLPIRWSDEGA